MNKVFPLSGFLFSGSIITILLLGFISGTPQPVSATNTTDTVTIAVTVLEQTMVDINPSSLSWTNVRPGGIGNSTNEANNYTSIQIENIGSKNITNIWFNTSYPTSKPFGTANATLYDAGNFVVISKNDDDHYYFVNRVDYNDSEIVYLLRESGYDFYGRFRNASSEYFWVANPGVGTNCSSGATAFRLGNKPHNQSGTGSIDFTTASEYTTISLTTTEQTTGPFSGWWGVGNNTAWKGLNQNYCIAINEYCNVTVFYKYNYDMPACDAKEFFSSTPIAPGASAIGDINVHIPYGVYYGAVNSGTLTVFASDE